jgi:hypothetical protein
VVEFNPNEQCRALLQQAAAEENRDVLEFPEAHRHLAKPLIGLAQSLAALFWLFEFKPKMPMETMSVVSSAVDIAKQIRGRSLSWLRRELALNCPGINSVETQVLEKMRQTKCALSRRQLLRSFHRMHRQQLNEALEHLRGMGLVQDHGGKVLAV